MVLRVVTSVLFVIGLVAAGWLVWLQATLPVDAPRRVLADHAVRMALAFAVGGMSLVGAAIGSVLMVRRARLKYFEQSKENLRELVQGASDDLSRKG